MPAPHSPAEVVVVLHGAREALRLVLGPVPPLVLLAAVGRGAAATAHHGSGRAANCARAPPWAHAAREPEGA